MRLPKQVLVIPFKIEDNEIKYCVFRRKDLGLWQFVAGGQEDYDESTVDAAKREFLEETGINAKNIFMNLKDIQKYQ